MDSQKFVSSFELLMLNILKNEWWYYHYSKIMSEETKSTEPTTVELSKEQVQQVLDTQVSVKISLLRQMSMVIDVCNKRAAFKTEELEGVGALFKALNGAVEEVTKQVVAAKSDEGAALETVSE